MFVLPAAGIRRVALRFEPALPMGFAFPPVTSVGMRYKNNTPKKNSPVKTGLFHLLITAAASLHCNFLIIRNLVEVQVLVHFTRLGIEHAHVG